MEKPTHYILKMDDGSTIKVRYPQPGECKDKSHKQRVMDDLTVCPRCAVCGKNVYL